VRRKEFTSGERSLEDGGDVKKGWGGGEEGWKKPGHNQKRVKDMGGKIPGGAKKTPQKGTPKKRRNKKDWKRMRGKIEKMTSDQERSNGRGRGGGEEIGKKKKNNWGQR